MCSLLENASKIKLLLGIEMGMSLAQNSDYFCHLSVCDYFCRFT